MAEDEEKEKDEDEASESPLADMFGQRIRWRQGYVPVAWRAVNVDISIKDRLPPYLAAPPREGDTVEASTGRIFRIVGCTHVAAGNAVFVRCDLGRDTGGSSPMGGGGSAGGDDW